MKEKTDQQELWRLLRNTAITDPRSSREEATECLWMEPESK